MRYNEQAVQPQKEDKPGKEKAREMTKPGQYSSSELQGSRKIMWRK